MKFLIALRSIFPDAGVVTDGKFMSVEDVRLAMETALALNSLLCEAGGSMVILRFFENIRWGAMKPVIDPQVMNNYGR